MKKGFYLTRNERGDLILRFYDPEPENGKDCRLSELKNYLGQFKANKRGFKEFALIEANKPAPNGSTHLIAPLCPIQTFHNRERKIDGPQEVKG